MIVPNPGDTVNIIIVPSHSPTTATVVSVDAWRHQVVVTHASGALIGRTSTMHLDHIRALTDFQAPRVVGTGWV